MPSDLALYLQRERAVVLVYSLVLLMLCFLSGRSDCSLPSSTAELRVSEELY